MAIRVLAFNTVTDLCSVALMIDRKIYTYNILTPRLHAENILSMINQLLIDTGVKLKSLDYIVFDQGPGSFIGVRLGLSIAQGLALGSDLPLIAVSSLEVLAQGAWRLFSAKNIITTIYARAHELYYSCYSKESYKTDNSQWVCMDNACLINIKTVKSILCKLEGNWALVGTGWNTDSQLVNYIDTTIDSIILKKIMLPEAQDMLLLSISSFKKSMFLTPNQINPMYLYSK